MKIIVSKYVYARVGAPSTGVCFSGYRSPGEVITVDDIVVGTEIDGNAVWYHCQEDSCYYWSGGCNESDEILKERRGKNAYSPLDLMNLYRSAANELSARFRFVPGYRGIAAGYKIHEKIGKTLDIPSLTVFVDRKLGGEQAQVPTAISYRGLLLTTDVKVVEVVDLHEDEDPEDGPPYMMGGSIATVEYKGDVGSEKVAGTRSLIVKKNNKRYLLTCYHVACDALFKNKIYTYDKSVQEVHVPSRTLFPATELSRGKVIEGGFGLNFDYALLEIDLKKLINIMPGFLFTSGCYSFEDLSTLNKETRLYKYGNKTKATNNSFHYYPGNDIVVDKTKGLQMSGLIITKYLSEKGDSGAPVVDGKGKIVGILIGGTSEFSYVIPIAQLISSFHIKPDI